MQTNSTTSDPIIKEVLLDAPVEKVWNAITDKEDMKKWYFDIAAFKPEVGFTFTFYGEKDGRKFVHLCTIKEVEINKKLSHTWTYQGVDGETMVHFELYPQGKQTRLRLTHEGLENLPQTEDFAKDNFEKGWTYIIETSLKNFFTPQNNTP
jgi:uncharacterized protein YndB with AHSA1/START domain